jgi:hypothetical protein
MLLVSPISKLNEVTIKDPLQTWVKISARPVMVDISENREIKAPESLSPTKKDDSGKGIDFDNYKFEGDKNNATNTSTVASINLSNKKEGIPGYSLNMSIFTSIFIFISNK